MRPLISLAFVAFCAVAGSNAAAADIRTLDKPGDRTVIVLVGEMVDTDGERFAEIASQRQRALVVFSSPGGNLLAGLRIGQFIRLHNFATLVPDGQHCASACALAWLGGSERYMEPHALIGFHEAYTRDGRGQAQVSGPGNALVGAYLSRLGLSDEAILYIERSRPEDITWLTERAAQVYGISVTIAPARPESNNTPASVPAPPPPGATPAPQRSPEEIARLFSATYFTHWSESNRDALAYFQAAYAPRVTFYGTPIDRGIVLDQKRKFADRWPERVYAVRNETVRSRCEGDVCAVGGVVDWDAHGTTNTRTTGSAHFRLDLAMQGIHPLILSETGAVISRGEPETGHDDKPPAKESTPDAKITP